MLSICSFSQTPPPPFMGSFKLGSQAPSTLSHLCRGISAVDCVFFFFCLKKHNLQKNTMHLLLCSSHAGRTQQIQHWWAGSGRLEGCRLHAMKLIDSCKSTGTQSSAKETYYCKVSWCSSPHDNVLSEWSFIPGCWGIRYCCLCRETTEN